MKYLRTSLMEFYVLSFNAPLVTQSEVRTFMLSDLIKSWCSLVPRLFVAVYAGSDVKSDGSCVVVWK